LNFFSGLNWLFKPMLFVSLYVEACNLANLQISKEWKEVALELLLFGIDFLAPFFTKTFQIERCGC